jgi:hypothetical protein
MADLPNSPRECREQAWCYADLAFTAVTPEDTEHFASLAKSWTRLAAEIEAAQAFLNVLNQIEADEPRYSEAA